MTQNNQQRSLEALTKHVCNVMMIGFSLSDSSCPHLGFAAVVWHCQLAVYKMRRLVVSPGLMCHMVPGPMCHIVVVLVMMCQTVVVVSGVK